MAKKSQNNNNKVIKRNIEFTQNKIYFLKNKYLRYNIGAHATMLTFYLVKFFLCLIIFI